MDQQFYTGAYRRPAEQFSATICRELTHADLVIRQSTPIGSKPKPLKNLRATHHRLAQLLATAHSPAECAVLTSYSIQTIYTLQVDPAFKELITHYSTKRDQVFMDLQGRMAGFATDAIDIAHERLLDNPESFNNKELTEIIKVSNDRGGNNPVQKSETKTLVLSAQDLINLKAGVAERQNGQVRKVNLTEEAKRVKDFVEGKNRQISESSRTLEAGTDVRGPSALLEASKAEGSAGQGDNIREASWEDVTPVAAERGPSSGEDSAQPVV